MDMRTRPKLDGTNGIYCPHSATMYTEQFGYSRKSNDSRLFSKIDNRGRHCILCTSVRLFNQIKQIDIFLSFISELLDLAVRICKTI